MKVLYALILMCLLHSAHGQERFREPGLEIDSRVQDLIGRLTLEEKISLLGFQSRAVDRLQIPAYNWWNEALHGVARAGEATVFPQAIGLAATFDSPMVSRVGDVISTEARAKNNLFVSRNRRGQYMGLTFWSPNINILRDPRWGRGQETYGEDPYLTGTMGSAFVLGLQGNDPLHLKTAAGAKHFAVHSGPEKGRHSFNAIVDEKDLRETYLYAFHNVVDQGVEAIMCAYNRVNGEPCCTGPTLMQSILRKEWGFKGHSVTDCWALEDIWQQHQALPSRVAVAAAAIKAGIGMDCGVLLQEDLLNAVQQGLITEAEINHSLASILRTQVKLGFFDPPAASPWKSFGADSVANEYHRALARKMAAESMVLLKNDNHLLPLRKSDYGSIMVVGPNAASLDALLGNYHGVSGKAVNFVEGIASAVGPGTRVEYDQGCDYTDTRRFGGIWAAGNAELTIAVLGFTPVYEGEEGDAFLSETGGDRDRIALPPAHVAYLKELRARTKTPIVLVLTGGSSIDVAAVSGYADAIVMAWYPGEQGGNALADLLFGESNPSGRLPITFYPSLSNLPAYEDYRMEGRTYRYYRGDVQYPFGYGLSYTTFRYTWSAKPAAPRVLDDTLRFTFQLSNTGSMDGADVSQLYVVYPQGERMPLRELKAYARTDVRAGGTQSVTFRVPVRELLKWDLVNRQWRIYPGTYRFVIGQHSRDEQLSASLDIRLKQSK
ncbi:MAG: glycoside hydrolase family 3 C-terminal domain-containing protein [Cyclobacteriaceae bacterium]|nr:glycoside hydrolase family 3 C-terminal domain-containing protein [Cyclobacteriaceae bacterium]